MQQDDTTPTAPQTKKSREWDEWRPQWAPLVNGRYERREHDRATGMPEPQKVTMECTHCGATWQTTCSSGHVRLHISNFAKQHTHRDPLDAPTIVRPGSKRASMLGR